MMAHTWLQACAGVTFLHPHEITHPHGTGINASNYKVLHQYHKCMYTVDLLQQVTKSESGKFENDRVYTKSGVLLSGKCFHA